jgi:tRNA A-37 threonylcarbamoyl transferase component Bud32
MAIYRKNYKDPKPGYVKREAGFLRKASRYGLSPKLLSTDNKTFIEMDDLKEMTVEDMYGSEIEDIPPHILAGMFSLVWTLYHVCKIQYRDLWPRNFIAKGDRIWIIDFGDATKASGRSDEYLMETLKNGKITHWNPAFN